jgi:hypothetical protein
MDQNNQYPGDYLQPLFDLMYNEHNLTLLESEMKEIVHVVEKMTGQHHARKEDHDKEWESFWKRDVCNHDGTINIEQVKKELYDFSFIMEQVPKVYCHITGGMLSKIMYRADTVIRAADDHFNKELEESIKQEIEEMEGSAWITGQYNRLYDQLKADPEKHVVCYVDYTRDIGNKLQTWRDICTINGEAMEFVSRGHRYAGIHYMSGNPKTNFIDLCGMLKVQWLDESRAVNESNYDLINALNEITNYKHECGCMPCMGQCQSAESFKLDLEGLIEIAANAIAKHKEVKA